MRTVPALDALRPTAGKPTLHDSLAVLALAAGAAAAAALAGTHPTGTPVLDPVYAALLSTGVVVAAAAADRGSVLWLAVVAAALSRHWLIVPGAAALVIAFTGTLRRQRSRLVGALSAAAAIEVVLRWPPVAFHGATALIAVAAIVPVVVSAMVSSGHSRLAFLGAGTTVAVAIIVVVPAAVAALMSRSQIESGISAAEGALAQVRAGNAEAGRARLAVAERDFASAERRLSAWWTAPARAVPVAAQQRQALSVGMALARQVVATAEQQAGSIDFGRLRYTHGGIDLASVEALRKPLATLGSTLDSAEKRLASIRSAWLVPPIASRLDKLNSQLRSASSTTSLAELAVRSAPGILGADGTRRYFVAFTDPAENRGLGGLLVWYGVLTATNGHLSLTRFGDALNLDTELAAIGGGRLTGPPGFVARYGRFDPQDFLIDATYSPDLPTVTDVVSQLFTEAGNPPIDGMIVLDPTSVASLLHLTGPIEAPGLGLLTASNTAEMLDRGQYALYPALDQQHARKAALDTALRIASDRLSQGDLPGARALLDTLGPDVRDGDLLFWSLHRSDQELLYRTGLAGAFPEAKGGDLLSVVTQNAANNKIDAYLRRTISDSVSFAPSSGGVRSKVRITLRNGAPPSGLSSEVIGSYQGSGLAPGTNLAWLTIYSPLQLAGATLDGRHLALRRTPELGVNAYSGYVTIPAGATATVSVNLYGRITPGPYRITIHQQPTVIPDQVSVRVARSGSGTKATQNWNPGRAANIVRIFRFSRE